MDMEKVCCWSPSCLPHLLHTNTLHWDRNDSVTRSLCTGLLRESRVERMLSSRGRLVVTHQDSRVGSVGMLAMLGDREDSLASSALTLVTRWAVE